MCFIIIPGTAIICDYYSLFKLESFDTATAEDIVAMAAGSTAATLVIIIIAGFEIYKKYKNTEIAHCPRYKESEEK